MKKKRFGKALAIYAAALVVLIGAGLAFLWQYLDAYERSLPNGVVEAYERDTLHEDYRETLSAYADSHANPFQSREEILAWLDDALEEDTLRLRKSSASGDPVYSIRLGGREIGRLYLTMKEEGRFGFNVCAMDRTEWNLPEGLETVWKVTAPEEAQVLVNGIVLSEQTGECSLVPTDRDAMIQSLQPVNDCVYTFRYFGAPEFTVAESTDRMYTLTESSETERSVTAVCSGELSAEITDFAEEFAEVYVLYTAAKKPFSRLAEYLVPDSPLHDWILISVGTRKDVRTGSTVLDDLTVDNIVPYGDGVLCDVHYQITDYRRNVFHVNLQLLLVSVDGQWLVQDMGNY